MSTPILERTDWRQVAIATLTQNVATGFAFGSFGTLVLAIEHEYGATRTQSSLAISLLVVALSVTASLLGRVLDRRAVRPVMMAGAAAGAVGYGLLAVVHGTTALILVYAAVLGPAAAALGVLPSMTLATGWTAPELRGRALGIVNMPILVMIVPLVLGQLIDAHGVRSCYAVLAVGQALMLPVLLLVREPPRATQEARSETATGKSRSVLGSPAFWLLVVAVGLIAGAGTMKLAHFVPLLVGQGRTFAQANGLLALAGGTGLVGSVAFGLLADRIGGAWALVVNAVVQAVVWTVFLMPVSMALLVADAVIVGACGGGVQSALGVLVASLFGVRSFGRAYGILSLCTLPFLFGLTPLAGALYDATGSYHLPMGLMIGGFLLSSALLLPLVPRERLRRASLEENR